MPTPQSPDSKDLQCLHTTSVHQYTFNQGPLKQPPPLTHATLGEVEIHRSIPDKTTPAPPTQDSKCPISDTRILLDPRVFFFGAYHHSLESLYSTLNSVVPHFLLGLPSSFGSWGYSSSCLLWSCTSLGLPTLALVYLLYLFLASKIQAKDLFLADFLPISSILLTSQSRDL